MMTRPEFASSEILNNRDNEFSTEISDLKPCEFGADYSNPVYQNFEFWAANTYPMDQFQYLQLTDYGQDDTEKHYNLFDRLHDPEYSINSCRICGIESPQVTPLFSDDEKDSGESSLADKINFCLPIKITMQDALPKYICFECKKHVEDCHKLFLLCMQTEELLLAKLEFSKTLVPDKITLKCPLCPGNMQEKVENDFNSEFATILTLQSPISNLDESQVDFSAEFLQINEEIKENDLIFPEETMWNSEINGISLDHLQTSINNLVDQNNPEFPDNIEMAKTNNLDILKLFFCEFCDFDTANVKDASRHLESCTAKQSDALKNSQQSDKKLVQKDVKRLLECHYCKKNFKFKEELVRHIRIHTGERPYKCQICEKAFSQSSGLSTHLKVHSNVRPFGCSMCERRFKMKNDRDSHEKQHAGLRPYKCDICSKAFMTLQVFSQHKKIHTNERPYKCKDCGEAFRRSHVLTVHMLRHTGEKPHVCDICLKAYRQRGDLIKHKRIQHGDKLSTKSNDRVGKNKSHKFSDNASCQSTF